MEGKSDYNYEKDIGEVTGVPPWYRDVYRENRKLIGLSQEQQEVIATNRDADALTYGLLRFPNLRRVVVSPAAHGMPGRPFYATPSIRSLPRRLLYPIPRGWPITKCHDNYPEAEAWDGPEKDKWRGYCLVSRIIAQHLRENPGSKLADLVTDTNQLRTGISCRIFDEAENSERRDLITILSQPGFSRLDLSLYCANQHEVNWSSFRSGHLRNTLARATSIKRISLFTNIAVPGELDDPDEDGEEHFIPLRNVFPVDDWHQLRHFGLCRFIVKKDNVVEFLGALPPTLGSVELSFLIFLPDQGDYHALMQNMREKLDWCERRPEDQPKIRVRVDVDYERILGAVLMDISREVANFMYHDGENPFDEDEGWGWFTEIPPGVGMLLDAFDSESESEMRR
ncbi:hypothetical protein NW762_014472 [Fusarium torreyae]|uniref:Uncharacterized protein n=1 Tax=Fusarium torreyae TaxID=1237075 RepID=A0A9W8V6N5_9HYPO|nr:hypothetical protein NW762_014472 [Fusarium torreyae]